MYDGWDALRTGLKAINGSTGGYWYDFSTRVYDRLVLPSATTPDVYLCIPFADEPERFEEQEQHSVRCKWSQTIFAFARDTKEHDTETEMMKLISRARDDVVKYLLDNPTLGGAVYEARLVSALRTAGALDADDYGELELLVEIEQVVQSSDLGSAA
jgi:hypothetical protein